jgi:hypothetical protein
MGLPGSGKTTLAEKISQKLNENNIKSSWHNGDKVRSIFEDWDFSIEGRIRQTERMAKLATEDSESGLVAICDYVCPTESLRNKFESGRPSDLIIWMDTIETGRFEDTNKMFETPTRYDYRITEFNSDHWADVIVNKIVSGDITKFDNKKPTVQLLGRYQPWHLGHTTLFERALEKTGQVCIMVRDCQGWNNNPFDFNFVKRNIEIALQEKYAGKFIVMLVPNIVEIVYGRDVGYKINKIELPEDIQAISATEIRKNMGL